MVTSWRLGLSVWAGMAMLSYSTFVQAVTLGSVQIQSTMNEPLKAKIPLSNLNVPLNQIRASLASSSTYRRVGATSTGMPKLNFSVQDAGNGRGYLLVTSAQPVKSPYLDLILDVDAGSEKITHQAPLLLEPPKRKRVDIAKSKPAQQAPISSSSKFNNEDVLLVPSRGTPPPMSGVGASVNLPSVTSPATSTSSRPHVNQSNRLSDAHITPAELDYGSSSVQSQATSTTPTYDTQYDATVVARQELESLRQQQTNKPTQAQSKTAIAKQPATKNKAPKASATKRTYYTVARHDTLWEIATRLARQNNMSVNQVMDSIQALNKKAFIRGNRNLIRAGSTITLPRYSEVSALARDFRRSRPASTKPARAAESNKARSARLQAKKAKKYAAKSQNNQPSRATAKVDAKSTNNLAQTKKPKAELSIVTPKVSEQVKGESTGSSVAGKTNLPPQIASQVRKAREATVTKRKSVNKLNTELSSFTKKIELQNAKLAELEKRLKQLQANNKS